MTHDSHISLTVPLNTPSLLPRLHRQTSDKPLDQDDNDNDMETSIIGEGGVNSAAAGDGGGANNEVGGAGIEQGEQPSGDSKTDNQTLLRLLEEGDKVRRLIRR